MVKRALFAISCLSFLFVAASPSAQAQPAAGPQIGYDTESESLGLGISGIFDIGLSEDLSIQGNPGFTYYLVEDQVTLFTVDFNAQYPFEMSGSILPFIGAGLGLQRWSVDVPETSVEVPGVGSFSSGGGVSNSEIILNLLGGAQLATEGPFKPYAGLTVSVGGTDRLELLVGVRYVIGG